MLAALALLLLAQDSANADAIEQDRAHGARKFVQYGFQPVGQGEPREVRRLIVEPWAPGSRPGIEIERMADGSVRLALVRPGQPAEIHALPRERWAEIVAHDAAIFAPPVRKPGKLGVSCHGTWAWFQSAGAQGSRIGWGWECPGGTSAMTEGHGRAIDFYLGLTLATRPDCKPSAQPQRSDYQFQECFAGR